MTRVFLVALITSCVIGTAMAQSCESKAISAEGKALHGATKTSFIRKWPFQLSSEKHVKGAILVLVLPSRSQRKLFLSSRRGKGDARAA